MESSPHPPFAAIAVTLAGFALLAAMVLAIPELRDAFEAAVRGDTAEVRSRIEDLGVAGPLLILGLALIHAVVFYPAEIVDAAAGFVYGFFPALALTMLGWLLSGLLCFAVGRCSTAGSGAAASSAPRRQSSAAAPPCCSPSG
jgi:uncharacterized membrane protein YdjX (TVP38/TMEM64 family)